MGYTRTPDAAGRTKTIFLVNGFKNPALRAGHQAGEIHFLRKRFVQPRVAAQLAAHDAGCFATRDSTNSMEHVTVESYRPREKHSTD